MYVRSIINQAYYNLFFKQLVIFRNFISFISGPGREETNKDLSQLVVGLHRSGSEVKEPVTIEVNSDRNQLPESPYLINAGKNVLEEV